ncbi:MAG: hypothetical protein CVV27_17430 [Candidatus Melainabacteria bacterium HGW-Melainabacteria-1]|nr:MAG: hypothetical protein CVV27_17430 [Candidatus Melainabacteria bacterium HGW-Melainabacteria-1]
MINQDVFDKLLEIGGTDLARKVIDLFLEHTPGKVQSLRTGLEQQDCKAIERAAHSIKSSGANLGLEELRQLASELELAANRGEFETCASLVPQLENACVAADAALQVRQKEMGPL